MDEAIYKLDQFPQDGRLWRVNLFGEIDRNDPIPSDPLIEIIMSPIFLDQARVHGIASNLAVDNSGRRSFWVNSGYLPLIRIGSGWQDGVRLDPIGLGGIEVARFPGLNITSSTARLVPADMRLDDAGREFLIPMSAYHLGGRGLRTQFLSIDHDGVSHRVLIPVVEVGRFYYFCSSELTKRLLWGLLDDNGGEVFSVERSHPPVDGVGHVHLRMHIPDDDAWVVSRFAHSPLALARARLIHDSIAIKKANGQPLVPDILPPFDGETDLVAHGKWFTSGGKRRFLVFWINSCSHPFPASHLRQSRDLDGRSDGVDDPTRPELKMPIRTKPKNKDPRTKRLRGDAEPRKNLIRLESFLHEARFTDLAVKVREKVEKGECRFRTVVRPQPMTVYTDGWTSGDGTYGPSDGAPITIVTVVDGSDDEAKKRKSRPLSYPPSLAAVEQAILHLSQMSDISYLFIQVNGETGYGNATLFPKVCREHPGWPYVGNQRRQALVAELCYAGTYHYLFEAERRNSDKFTTLYVRDWESHRLGDDVLAQVLDHCAKNNGAWLKDKELPELNWQKLKHTWPTPAAFAMTLLGLLKSIVSQSANNTRVRTKGLATPSSPRAYVPQPSTAIDSPCAPAQDVPSPSNPEWISMATRR